MLTLILHGQDIIRWHNMADRKEYFKKYAQEHKEEIKKKRHELYLLKKEERLKYRKNYYKKNGK